MSTQTAQIIGKRYVLMQPIGQGGMGEVFRAHDRLTGETVALKRVHLPPEKRESMTRSDGADLRMALAREFRTLASLRHPNIISVLDYGFDEQRQPYFTMDLLENTRTLLEAGRDRSVTYQIGLLFQMFQALAYLHRRGILHRDLKPDNVLVVEDQVKLLDFGLAAARGDFDPEEQLEEVSGTLAYMAPELVQGFPPSEASDLYATGVMAYEILAGRYPFSVPNMGSLVQAILFQEPDVAALEVDARIVGVLGRLLAKNPVDRYQDAGEIIRLYNEATQQDFIAETPATRDSFLQAAQFVGREREFETLGQALENTLEGQGSAWLIGGESGVGKSRLLDELRALALVNGASSLRGQAVSDGSSPYQAWREVIRWLVLQVDLTPLEASVLKTLVPDIAALIGREVADAPELDPQTMQNRLLNIVEAIFKRVTHPLVVILEDIHWAGSESIALLRRLNSISAGLPLLLVASYRDDEYPNLPQVLSEMRVLKLERLEAEHIAALSASMLGEAGRQPEVVDLLQRETEGNVFFMVEVVRALAEEAGQLDRIGTITLPKQVFAGGMQLVIRRRLERVPTSARALLEVAAVAGRQLDLDILRAIDKDINMAEWLLTCANAAVIEVQDDRWRFGHDKLREGLLAAFTPETRQKLHRRVAEAIEQVYPNAPEQTAALAYHWHVAQDIEKEAHYLALAGEQALNNGAYTEALKLLESALEVAPRAKFSLERQAVIERQIGEAHYAIGGFIESRRHLERVLVLLGNPLPASRAGLALGLLRKALRQVYHRVRGMPVKNAQPLNLRDRQKALAYERIAQVGILTNDTILSVYTALSMLNLAERGGPAAELARAYVAVGFICGAIPQRKWADAYNRRAWETAQQVGNLPAIVWVLEIRSMYGIGACKWDESLDSLTQAYQLAEQIGDLRRRDEARGLVAVVLYYMGRLEDAHQHSLYHMEVSEHREDIYLPLLVQAEIKLRYGYEGCETDALVNLHKCLSILSDNSGIEVEIWTCGLTALAYLRMGQLDLARHYAERGLTLTGRSRPALCYVSEGYACIAEVWLSLWEMADDPAEKQALRLKALQACKALHSYARIFLHGKARAYCWQGLCEWLDGKADKAVGSWRKAAEEAKRNRMPFDEGLAHYELARHLPLTDAAQNTHYRRALELFEQTGTQYDYARTQALPRQ